MKYKKIILGLCLVFVWGQSFAQQETTNDGTNKAHEGVSFNLPSGDWVPVSKEYSLIPYIDNKLQEQLENTKKIMVIFSSQGGASNALDLLDEAKVNLIPKFNDILVTEKATLLSDKNLIGSPMKYFAVYRATDPQTGAPMRIEIVVATQWKQKGSKGVLYIITPEQRYFTNRFDVAAIRDSLTINPPAETKN